MAGKAERQRGPWGRWRVAGWGAAVALVLLPWLAMQVTDEAIWGLADFVVAGLMLAGVGATFEAAVRRTGDRCYRAAVAVALAAAFLRIWVNGAVGIIGSEENPANLLYNGVLAVGIALLGRIAPDEPFRADGYGCGDLQDGSLAALPAPGDGPLLEQRMLY